MGWAIGAVGIVVGFGALLLFLRSGGGDGGQTRLGPDGFFVRGFRLGHRVRWRARVNGTWRSGVAVIAGDETFVYTGAAPTDVQVEDDSVADAAPPSSVPVPPSSDDDGSSFAGFPSAY